MTAETLTRQSAPPSRSTPPVDGLISVISSYSYRFGSEVDLHKGISHALSAAGIRFEHEFVAGPFDRFDFLTESAVVLEVKINGSLSKALLQCKRYAQRDDVAAVILVTTQPWGQTPDNNLMVHGKPLRIIKLRRSSF